MCVWLRADLSLSQLEAAQGYKYNSGKFIPEMKYQETLPQLPSILPFFHPKYI